MKACPILLAALLTLCAAVALAAYSPGGAAYTKRVDTALLDNPSPLGQTVARIDYGHKLKVEEVRGLWLRVSEGAKGGWVFAGNLAEQKPAETKDLGYATNVSATSAAAAARPLAPASVDFANRHNLGQARSDLDWLRAANVKVTADQVQTYMKEKQKGEFQ